MGDSHKELADSLLPEELKKTADTLLDLKINSPEIEEIPVFRDMNGFLNFQVETIEKVLANVQTKNDDNWEELNRFFLDEITDMHL